MKRRDLRAGGKRFPLRCLVVASLGVAVGIVLVASVSVVVALRARAWVAPVDEHLDRFAVDRLVLRR